MSSSYLKDRFFLMKSNLLTTLLYLLVGVSIYYFRSFQFSKMSLWLILPIFLIGLPHFAVNVLGALLYFFVLYAYNVVAFSLIDIPIIISAVLLGFLSASMMHNAAHLNFSKRWISELVGLLCGFHQGMPFKAWQTKHVLFHHRYPDNPELDPHPPMNDSFLKYIILMKYRIARSLEKNYYHQWGKSNKSQRDMGLTGITILLSIYSGFFVWFEVLGPKYFLLFFTTSNFVTLNIYHHFNYYTHRPTISGQHEVVDLDKGIFKVLNWITFGSYFHRTHHRYPKIFNPGKISKTRPKQLDKPPLDKNLFDVA